MKNKQKLIYGAVAGVSSLLVSTLVAQYFSNSRPNDQMTAMNKLASEINKSLPMMVDNETQLTSTVASEKAFTYMYKLVNQSLQENPDLPTMLLSLKPGMVQRNCTTQETRREFLDKGITISYDYYDKDSRHIARIEIALRDCEPQ